MKSKRVIVKIGTSLTTMPDGRLNLTLLAHLVEELSFIHDQGVEFILVSSGAVAAGRRIISKSPHSMADRQALSCVGQPYLMDYYRDFFGIHNKYVGQSLFTTRDFADKQALGMMKNVLESLLNSGIIPVVNENDAASDVELDYGDNDQLASRIASLLDMDMMIVMSDVQGLYDKNPHEHPDAQIISEIAHITPEIEKLAGTKTSANSMGGMTSKLEAIKRATEAGIPAYLIYGREQGLLKNIVLAGKKEGTFFQAQKSKNN